MPARAKGKTPGRPTRKSSRQGNDSALSFPGTPGWQPATSDMFASPSFTPPQSPPRSRQVKGGRVTKTKAEPKSRLQTLASAAKVLSPRLTRGRRATMLPSELVTIKSPPGTRRRMSIYQKPGAAKKGTAAEDFKIPDPVAIMRAASRKKSPKAKKASPKRASGKQAEKPLSPKATFATKSPPKKKSPAKKSPAKKPSPRKSPAKKPSPKKSPLKKQMAVKEKTPKVTTRIRTPAKEISTIDILVTPSNATLGSIKKGVSTGRATRSAKQIKATTPRSPKVRSTTSTKKPSPASAKLSKSLKNTSIRTPRGLGNLTDSSVNNNSIYSSPKVDTPAIKVLAKNNMLKEKMPFVTPVNMHIERLRTMDTESAKRVRIQSEKSDSLTKVYRKTPSRGPAIVFTTTETTESTTGTPIKAARILGKTPMPASGKKLLVKPKKLADSLISPKTSTPRELRKRRADLPEPVSEIRQSKKIALDTSNEESMLADITADLSVARPADVRPSGWWGWCNIL